MRSTDGREKQDSYPQQPGYPPAAPQNHPRATTALVLGILSLVVCGLLGPFAWKIGKDAMNDIDASGGQIGGRGLAHAGYICGLIATILVIVGIAVVAVIVIIGGLAGADF